MRESDIDLADEAPREEFRRPLGQDFFARTKGELQRDEDISFAFDTRQVVDPL